MIEFLQGIRSLGFGALFGAGVFGLAYSIRPTSFAGAGSLREFMMVGGVLGAGLHQIIDRYVGQMLVAPAHRFVRFYSRLAQAEFLFRIEVISARDAARLKREIVDEYLVRGGRPSEDLLPRRTKE